MLKDLKFILKENVIRFDEKGNILPGRVSSFGYKFTFGSELYGSYMVICKPTVTPQDIMESLESLCPEIEQLLNEFAADVVPKSEVERLKEQIERLQSRNNFLEIEYKNQGNLFWARVNGVKSEAAREIFAEIEKHKTVPFGSKCEVIPFYVIAALKKKYTEEK